jgi:acyl-coenzyme A synthetase/AMP-(fatty) acid ligase
MNVFENIAKFSDKTALITDSLHTISYKKLIRIADSFGNKTPERSVVLLVCENSIESIASYVGFIKHSVVPIIVDNNYSIDSINNICNSYSVSYICASKLFLKNFKKAYGLIHSFDNYNLVKLKGDRVCFPIHNDLAILLTTSGSTGSPKFVRISYKNLYSNTRSISRSLPIKSDDVVITTMPMSYSYGLSIINTHLFNGASIVLTNKTMMEKGFWSLFSNTKVTTFGGVPFIYKMLKRLKFSEMNLGTLKYITQAGGRLELSLVDYFTSACKKNDFEFYIMYGQTEATARMSVISFNDMNDKKGSIGKAIPGGSFILIDGQGHEVIEGGIGELVYFGDNVSMGYAENYSDLVLKDVNKRRLKTGDIARQDSDGYYYILGRTKRFVKIFGVRTGLDEVENFLNDKGLECVCSGSDDDLKIYSTDSDSIDKIYKFISESRLIHHKGYSVHFIDSIPRNESGKVMYSHL